MPQTLVLVCGWGSNIGSIKIVGKEGVRMGMYTNVVFVGLIGLLVNG